MQTVSQAFLDTLNQETAIEMFPVVVAEWELNGYVEPTVTTNDDIGTMYWDDLFPLDSIAKPFRPETTGLPKFLVGESRIKSDNNWPKYRIPSEDSIYKYWKSHRKNGSNGIFATPLQITFNYGELIRINKITAGFETSWTGDVAIEIYASTDGTNFISIGRWTTDADGRVDVYLQDGGGWSTLIDRDNSTQVRALRLEVESMAAINSSAQVIQFSPRYEIELTNDVISASVEKVRESAELSSPVGLMQANTCNVEINNSTGRFDPDNTGSDLYGLIDENVRLYIDYKLVRNDNSSELVPQGMFLVDEWGFSSDGTASVSGTDRSKLLQETMMTNVLYSSKTISHIVRDVMERMGVTKFLIRTAGDDDIVPYVWFTDDTTVWEALSDFARAIQSVFYFDEDGDFVWETRGYIWQSDVIDTTLYAEASGTALANLEDLTNEFSIGANHVAIRYAKIHRNRQGKRFITTATWQPSDDIVLRGVQLADAGMTNSQMTIPLPSGEISTWPTEGMVNIEGEYMRFNGKSGNNLVVEERGVYNSPVFAHDFNEANWTHYQPYTGSSTVKYKKSVADINSGGTNGSSAAGHIRAGLASSSFHVYGTQIEFPVSYKADGTPYYARPWGIGGLFIHSDGNQRGYYFEIALSQFVEARNNGIHEIRVYKSEPGSRFQWRWKASGRPFEVIPGKKYQIDVAQDKVNNSFHMFVNGMSVAEFVDTEYTSGYFGVYTRGYSRAHFEYVYTLNSQNISGYPSIDIARYQDRITGSFASGYALRPWSGRWRSTSEWFFDDFGPWVHEGREFDARYEQAPALDSKLFISNDSDIHELEHKSNPFKSKFILFNAARGPAVLNGTDDIKYDEETYNQQLYVYGNVLVRDEEQVHTVTDDLSISRRGKKEFEVTSPWIQNKKMARIIGKFIIKHWGKPAEVLEVNTIINPALQVGDLVGIHYPDRNMSPVTHKYHIIGIRSDVGGNYNMSLTLRRAHF